MHDKQIRTFVSGYLHDRPQLTIDESAVYQDIKNVLDEIYEEDLDFYNSFYMLPLNVKIQILESFLDYEYNNETENINESITVLAGISAGALAALATIITKIYAGSRLTRAMYKTFEAIGKTVENIGKFLQKQGSKWRFKYEVVNKTFKQCLERAGINDLNKVGLPVYELLRKKNSTKLLATQKQIQQAETLRECYTEAYIKTLSLIADMYFNCLKESGRIDEFKKSSSRDVIVSLHSVPKMFRGSCNEIYQKLLDGLKRFDDYVEYMYPEGKDKEDVLERLRRSIVDQLNKH